MVVEVRFVIERLREANQARRVMQAADPKSIPNFHEPPPARGFFISILTGFIGPVLRPSRLSHRVLGLSPTLENDQAVFK
jgi:hypothetical protein